MKLINLKRYLPETTPFGTGVQYFIDEQGLDWFDSLKLFTKKYKLAIDPQTGIIRGITEDVSRLYPDGFSVVETEMLPEGCDISGKWQYREDGITAFRPSEEVLLTTNIKRRNTFLQQATTHAFPLQSALALGIATPQQQEMLMLLQHYGQHLMDMDLTQENPDWPLWPQETA
jgi:hypothetical protein